MGKHVAEQIAGLRREMEQRFDRVGDDISVTMTAIENTNRRVEERQADLQELRAGQGQLWRRLREVERRLGLNGGQGAASRDRGTDSVAITKHAAGLTTPSRE